MICVIVNKIEPGYTSNFPLIGRLVDAIQSLIARILSVFQRQTADGAFDLEAQTKEMPSLWDRTCNFASDHKVAIGVGVAVAILATGILAYHASIPSQTIPIEKKIFPLPSPPTPPISHPASPPIPPEELPYSDWLREETTHQSGNPDSPIALFTSYTRDNPDRLGLSQQVAANHRSYCEQQQYHHLVFEKNLADGALPYWSKIAGLKGMAEAPKNSGKEWFAWLDDDMVITNRGLKMESLIERFTENDHIIVTEDALSSIRDDLPLNTGFILARNSRISRHILNAIWNKRFEAIGSDTTYANCPTQSCFHEQQALTDLLKERPELNRFVRIIPQRFWDGIGINTFSRASHFDHIRKMALYYGEDPDYSKWRGGDFMAQCTGMATMGSLYNSKQETFELGIFNLRERCIQQLILQSSTIGEKIRSLLSSFFRGT